jgi:hypothetical protein
MILIRYSVLLTEGYGTRPVGWRWRSYFRSCRRLVPYSLTLGGSTAQEKIGGSGM